MASTSGTPAASDPRYKYQDIRPPSVPVEILDNLAANIFDPNAAKLGYIGMIYVGLKLVFAFIYLIAREKLLAAQAEYNKQVYERDQASTNQSDINKDNLSGEKR